VDEEKTPPEDSRPTRTSKPLESAQPEQIGNYRLLQKLGEGGMGEVWEAEQEEPVRRRVALKLIKAGMDTKQVVARFESERQALALMSHPSIAKVFDAGATEQGRPYFAMEYVKGEPLTQYCDKHRLSTTARLELFLQICDGVQHAHQKGIIHRDLKPSNVLVEVSAGKPVPKIIDFGVAKATQHRLTEKTMFTQLGVLVGTPAYMSPEQAEMTGLDVDTRTDVYSLGVMLYELLVGALPFDPKELKAAGYDEIRRKIREEEPSRPSARITTPGEDSTEAAKRRSVDLPTLRRELRGDLDWITMKALAKDRTRRYGSPNELAADVGRHLRHEPVEAGPPSTVYRLGKFVRRHRVSVAAGAVVLLAMIAGLAVATYGVIRATRAEAEARQEAATAEQVSDFLVGLFRVSDPIEARGREITAREILDQGAEKISRELQDQPLVRARLMATIAEVYGYLGVRDTGRELAQEALRIRREKLGNDHPAVADSLMTLAGATSLSEDLETTRSLFEQAIEIYERSVSPNDLRIAEGLAMLAMILGAEGRGEEMLPLLERVLAIEESALSPENPGEWASLAAAAESSLGLDWFRPLLEREIEIRERKLGPDHPTLVNCLWSLGLVLSQQHEYLEARRVLERSLELSERVQGRDHPDQFAILSILGSLTVQIGDLERARVLFERSLALNDRLLGPDHFKTAISRFQLGSLLSLFGEYETAESHLERALAIFEESTIDSNTAATMLALAHLRYKTGDLEQAQDLAERGMSIFERVFGPESPMRASALYVLSAVHMARGEWSEADTLFDEAQQLTEASLGEDHPELFYAEACRQALRGRRDEAIQSLRQALDHGFKRHVAVTHDPDFDSLRGDPEFEAVVAEIKQRADAEWGR
jgi:non-specific serine/threonine protein kinase/serine/threonine-protein kinase